MLDPITVRKDDTIQTVVTKEDIYLLISSVLLGVLFDILFYEKQLGISYLLFVLAFYLVFIGNLRRMITVKYSFGWFLSIPILALSSTYFIFSNQIFALLNFLMIPALIVAQTVLICGENKFAWFDTRFWQGILFFGAFKRALGNIPRPFVVGISSVRIRQSDEKRSVVMKVLIGLGISIPLLMVIISLLTAADRVFKHLVDQVLSLFSNIQTSDIPLQVLLILLVSVIIFSYIWSFLKPKDSQHTQIQGTAEMPKNSWDSVISITVLSLINCVYMVFILIQFAYMFSSFNNILPPDYTYAEYARRGFFELLMVTLINFSLLLSSIKFTRKDGKLVARTVRILHSLLVLFTMVILSSAFLRMSLYETAYGYTYLRVLTHSFMMYLFVLFVIAFYKIWNERISLLKPYIVVSLTAYLVLNFVNIDVLIAKNNINRYLETGKLDTNYFRNLSYDSIPVSVKLLNEENIPADFKRYITEQEQTLSQKQAWQSFNLSHYKAKQVLIKASNK